MRKLSLIILLSFLYLVLEMVAATTTLDQYWFCRDMEITDATNFSKPINCVEETKTFSTTDSQMVAVTKLSNLIEGDEIKSEIKDPNDAIISEGTTIIPEELNNSGVYYDYELVEIAGQNRIPGKYHVKMFINDNEVLSDEFEIYEETTPTCSEQGFYCCPEEKICTSPEEGECEEVGTCCASETQCQTISSETLTRTLITNCEETGLNECSRVIRLYDYSIHGSLEPEQTVAIEFRDIDIDCYEEEDITIAYYDETDGVWIEKNTYIEEVSEDMYNAKAQISYLGYIALIRTEACVPMLCTYGGYRTDPVGGYVNVEEPITFELCSMVSECEALENDVCNENCPEGVDPDCDECTSETGDCCLISYDNICDTDCAPYVDPDCCRKSDELCCAGGSDISDSEECDKNCDTGGVGCLGCTAASGDCCNANSDGVCDPDCPKLSNGVGYLDVDCCAANGISITNNKGDCCNTAQDGVCDCDCITGLDPDCVVSEGCCGDNLCSETESPKSCSSDCSCGDGICSPGTGTGFLQIVDESHQIGDENCENCPADCGECPSSSDYGAY